VNEEIDKTGPEETGDNMLWAAVQIKLDYFTCQLRSTSQSNKWIRRGDGMFGNCDMGWWVIRKHHYRLGLGLVS
jgi:hypothetical protein